MYIWILIIIVLDDVMPSIIQTVYTKYVYGIFQKMNILNFKHVKIGLKNN